jgi:hypothetical protein
MSDQMTRFERLSELECVIATATGLNQAIEELSTHLEGDANAARKLSAICAVAAAMHDNLAIGAQTIQALYELERERSSTG